MEENVPPVEPYYPTPRRRNRLVLGLVSVALAVAMAACWIVEFQDVEITGFVYLSVGFSVIGLVLGLIGLPRSPPSNILVYRLCFLGVFLCGFGLVVSLVVPGFKTLKAAQYRTMQLSHLKFLGTAMHNYAGTHNRYLPRAANGRPGEPGGLSWRVALLPYIEQDALYKEFHLDEPWDSPHNLTLLPRMPAVFKSFGNYHETDMTHFQVIVGSAGLFRDNRAPRLPKDFTNGTSNTILIAEGAEAVPWTKPADLVYNRGGPMPKLGGVFRENFRVIMGDASIHSFEWNDFPEAAIRSALSPDSEEIIPLP